VKPEYFLFPVRSQVPHQMLETQGTFGVAAAQQILDTMSTDKPPHLTASGI
jgi:hypothetical protein